MKALAAGVAIAIATAGSAAAAPRKVMVLHADGAIDAAAKTKIDAGVLALAKKIDGDISPGDITFADATAAVGCTGDVTACGDQVLDTLAVDELVVVTVEPAPGGEILVSVVRVSKVSQREAHGKVPAGKPEPSLTDAVGSLFGIAAKPKPSTTTTTTTPATTTSPAITTTTTPTPIEPYPTPTTTTTTPPTPPTTQPAPPPEVAQAEPTVTAAPNGVISEPEGGRRTSRLAIGGIAAGGGLMLIGVVLWNHASGIQSEIDKAPTRTHADLVHLQDLESSADSYALWGNVTFVVGVAVAGTGGFLLWRDRRSHQTARLTPMPVDHGAGVAITFGGTP